MNREKIYKKIYGLTDNELLKLENYIDSLKIEAITKKEDLKNQEDYENLIVESGIAGTTQEEIKNFLGENYLEQLMNWKKN